MENKQQNQPTHTTHPTLLDCFAMAALTGLITRGDCPTQASAAQAAYNIAEAMLEEKKKRERGEGGRA